MKATQVLPPNYHLSGTFDLKNLKQIILLNLIGLILSVFSIWFFSWVANQIRSESAISFSIEFSSISSALVGLGKLVLTIILVLIVHEALHAAFFWIFSGQTPIVGFKGAYAYAAMPGWYFPRNQYLVIGIAPLILITLIGLFLLAVVPVSILNLVLVALVINTSGAVGDLFVVIWLLIKPKDTVVLDKINTIEFYVPDKPKINQ